MCKASGFEPSTLSVKFGEQRDNCKSRPAVQFSRAHISQLGSVEYFGFSKTDWKIGTDLKPAELSTETTA